MERIRNEAPMMSSRQAEIVCRLIAEEDLDEVVDCLKRGFPERPRIYWTRALERLSRRPQIADLPPIRLCPVCGRRRRRGAAADRLPGGERRIGPQQSLELVRRRGISRLCAFAAYDRVKRKEATYLNISPAMHTRQGHRGVRVPALFQRPDRPAAPSLGAAAQRQRSRLSWKMGRTRPFSPRASAALLADHAEFGCRRLLCVKDGAAYPFVFLDRKIFRRLVPCPQLVYCRGLDEFVRFAGAIGRDLVSHRPVLPGRRRRADGGARRTVFRRTRAEIFQGADAAATGRSLHTELVLFGP